MVENYRSVSIDGTAAELVCVMSEQRLAGLVAELKKKSSRLQLRNPAQGGLSESF